MISLYVGNLQVDWGKNRGFVDHSAFFQPSDVQAVPYYYVADDSDYVDADGKESWKLDVQFREGLSKPLSEVKDRIELLGHTLENCRREFAALSGINDFDSTAFKFEALRDALATVDVSSLSLHYGEGDEDFGEFFREQVFPRLGMKLPADDARHVLFRAAEGMENLSSHSVLRLLAENPAAAQFPVIWAFKDLEENGWAKREEFVRPLDPPNRFLIVTEGSSDAAIIRQSLKLLKPHIADFFSFVDMEEGYPFSGTGNLFKFVQGLISIGVQNNIVVLFDNDAEGCFNYERCRNLNVPANMTIQRLPDLPEFERFPTEGPTGRHYVSINRQAAAIECYLQLDDEAFVRWQNYHSNQQVYQGVLAAKDRYKDDFLSQKERLANYEYRKIEQVLNMLIDACVTMTETAAMEDIKNRW